MKRLIGLLSILVLFVSTLSFSGVMMQGFYWDYTAGGTWYNTMKAQATALRNMVGTYGINRIWLVHMV